MVRSSIGSKIVQHKPELALEKSTTYSGLGRERGEGRWWLGVTVIGGVRGGGQGDGGDGELTLPIFVLNKKLTSVSK